MTTTSTQTEEWTDLPHFEEIGERSGLRERRLQQEHQRALREETVELSRLAEENNRLRRQGYGEAGELRRLLAVLREELDARERELLALKHRIQDHRALCIANKPVYCSTYGRHWHLNRGCNQFKVHSQIPEFHPCSYCSHCPELAMPSTV